MTTWAKGESPNNDADVKRLMAYLQALAEVHDVTIAVIGHTNKGKHEHFADMVAGSGAWTTSPRLSFVHARDRREEYAFAMRVAKSNLTSSFAATYTTEPVLTLHQHKDGHADVLCKVNADPVVWGEEASMELFEAATQKPDEGDGFEDRRQRTPTAVENAVQVIVETLMTTPDAPLTRADVEHMLEQGGKSKPDRHRWLQVDAYLAGHPTVERFNDPARQNVIVYRRKT